MQVITIRSWLFCLALLAGTPALAQAPQEESKFTDPNIERDVLSRMSSGDHGRMHVNVSSFNRRVLLTGEVESEAARAEIARIAAATPNVRAVSNELVVAGVSGVGSRTTDSIITSDVKFRLRGSDNVDIDDVRVVTENGTVYLMGKVRRRVGAAAAEIASTTGRVDRVVLVFDYLD